MQLSDEYTALKYNRGFYDKNGMEEEDQRGMLQNQSGGHSDSLVMWQKVGQRVDRGRQTQETGAQREKIRRKRRNQADLLGFRLWATEWMGLLFATTGDLAGGAVGRRADIIMSSEWSPRGFPGGSAWRIHLQMQEMRIQSLGWEEPLEKGMATHSSILAWRIPWAEEPGGLQSKGSQRVRHNWVTEHVHSGAPRFWRSSITQRKRSAGSGTHTLGLSCPAVNMPSFFQFDC